MRILCIHICTGGDKQFCDFLVIIYDRIMQRSESPRSFFIHIRAFVQFCLDTRKVAVYGSSVNRIGESSPHQQHGCDCCDQEVFHWAVKSCGRETPRLPTPPPIQPTPVRR